MKSFTFAILADSHIRIMEKGDGYEFYPSNQFANARSHYVVHNINQLNPELVIHLGDVIYPIPALPTNETAVQIAYELFQNLNQKLYVVPGNHDIGDKPNAWVPAPAVTETSHRIFEKYWGKTYSSFNHEDCHFVLINSQVLNSGLQMESEQKKWLETDLANNQKAGKRVFLFLHYPLYLSHPQEPEHYDNIAEPARAWLLALLEKYKVEAVFTAHSHNFFYNRYFNTDLYVIPSVAFVRPDFSEMFHIEPALEYGRNDIEKMGFCLVTVNKDGHQIELIRTRGQTEEREEYVITCPISLSEESTKARAAPVGVYLRHAWATSIELTHASLDEFTRKIVRNDYLLPALWELGIQKLRVPFGDLANATIRERIRVLQVREHKFNVFSVGIPSQQIKETIIQHHDLVDVWEVVVPRDMIPEAIHSINELKQKINVRTVLSRLDTIEDQQRTEEYSFSHFPSHGFQLEEQELLTTCVTNYDPTNTLDGFVFRLPPDKHPWEGIQVAEKLAGELGRGAVVHVQLPRASEGVMYTQDRNISNRIAESLTTAQAMKNAEVYLDTFVDHDRGYYPRNGLLDRRYNPRSSYYVFRHLQHALGSGQPELKMTKIETSTDARAFALETSQYRCILLLSEEEENRVELDLTWRPKSSIQEGIGKWMDLRTGKTKKIHWKQSTVQNDKITISLPSGHFEPALLILEP